MLRVRICSLSSAPWILALFGSLVTACRSDETLFVGTYTAGEDPACVRAPSAPTPELELDAFYEQSLNASGIPVLGSAKVDPRALTQACIIVSHLVSVKPEVLAAMVERKLRVAVIGTSEVLTNIPEYRDLYTVFPTDDWNAMRGVGATKPRPVSSVGQENLLCTGQHDSPGEFVLFQTFSHGLRSLGIEPVDDEFSTRLATLHGQALAAGLWHDTFASSEPGQYFAEGIQDWFDANAQATPPDGVHNDVNTRSELRAYDPALASLIAEYLPDDAWRPRCP